MKKSTVSKSGSMRRGIFFPGPSGSEKSKLVNLILADPMHSDRFGRAISHTSRKIRPGEVHGREYFFVSKQEFETKIAEKGFAEFAKFGGEYYGTSCEQLDQLWTSGKAVIGDVNDVGARQIRKLYPYVLFAFIWPTDVSVLAARLRERPGMTEKSILERTTIETPREMQAWHESCHLRILSIDQRLDKLKASADLVIAEYMKDPIGFLAYLNTDNLEDRTFS